MLGVFAFPALIPLFMGEWGLSNAQAGWIAGAHFAGYAAAVPVLSALTDRVDAKWIYLSGAICAALACAGFAVLPGGFWTALFLRLLGGVGLAGTYMPGLRALVDRTEPGNRQSLWMSWYTASFSLGTSMSFLTIGWVEEFFGWRAAYGIAATSALGAAVLTALVLKPARPPAPDVSTALLDFRPILADRGVMAYVVAYFAHTWELFALRSWQVAFLAFALASAGAAAAPISLLSPTSVATLSAMAAMAASIWGAGLAVRKGRVRVCVAAGTVSGLAALGFGFLSPLPYPVLAGLMLVYSALIQVDSAALTTGAVLMAQPGRKGATIAVHSLIGFTGGFLAPFVLGWVLDLSASDPATGWGLAFATIGLVTLTGPLILWRRRHILAMKPG